VIAWLDTVRWSCSIFCDSATIITYVNNNNNNNNNNDWMTWAGEFLFWAAMTESICFYFNAFLLLFSVLTSYCCTTVAQDHSEDYFFHFKLNCIFLNFFPPSFLRALKIIILQVIITRSQARPGVTFTAEQLITPWTVLIDAILTWLRDNFTHIVIKVTLKIHN